MKNVIAEIASIVDNIPPEKYSSKDLKIVVSEDLWNCLVDELKDYKATKDKIYDDFTVNSFNFEGVKVYKSTRIRGNKIFYGISLEEIIERFQR